MVVRKNYFFGFQITNKLRTDLAMSKSLVWGYFIVGRADDGCKIATCRLCDSDQDQPPTFRCSLNSTSSLRNHLQSKHQTEHDSLFRKKQIAILKKSATVIKQPTITAMFASVIDEMARRCPNNNTIFEAPLLRRGASIVSQCFNICLNE